MSNNERTLLGQILMDNGISHSLKIQDYHFKDYRNRKIFKAIGKIIAAGDVAAIDSLAAACPDVETAYIAQLTDLTPTAANFQFYENEILNHYRGRKLKELSAQIPGWANDPEMAIGKITAEIQQLTADTADDKISKLSDLSLPHTNVLEERFKLGGKLPGISSGYRSIDAYTLGFQNGRLNYIGGRPGDGKSALIDNLIYNIGKNNIEAGLISLENSALENMDRLTAIASQVDSTIITTGGFADQRKFSAVLTAEGRLHDMPIFIYDKANLNLEKLKIIARQMIAIHGVKILFIDYLQLIKMSGAKDRTAEVAAASTELKGLARDLNIPIVCAAQLTRDSENRKPTLSSFQWSSQAEQDGDICLLLQRSQDNPEEIFIHCEKNRDGKTGCIKMRFKPDTVTFYELYREVKR